MSYVVTWEIEVDSVDNRSSGVRGVYPNGDRWQAAVKHHGVQHYMGTYDTIDEAAEAAAWLRQQLFTHDDGKVLR